MASSTESSNETPDPALDPQAPKVTFHLGTSVSADGDCDEEDDDADNNEIINNNFQNTTMLCVHGKTTVIGLEFFTKGA